MTYPKSIQNLIEKFSRFPTVGPKTAARFVFYLLKIPEKETEEMVKLIQDMKKSVKSCSFCFKATDKELNCEICQDKSRDKDLLCLVEKEQDLAAIESTKKYKGLYFILGGNVSKLRPKDIEGLRIKELKERLRNSKIKELILALNSTTEGEATVLYLERELKPLNIKIMRLGRGLPTGGEIEYADEETISSALESRK